MMTNEQIALQWTRRLMELDAAGDTPFYREVLTELLQQSQERERLERKLRRIAQEFENGI
jgi:hypothetical protein